MAAEYPLLLIEPREIPQTPDPADQHLLDVYVSEINKIASVWRAFDDTLLDYRPHPKSTSVRDVFRHELLSGRRFFGEFVGLPEPDAAVVVPDPITVDACVVRLGGLRARACHILPGLHATGGTLRSSSSTWSALASGSSGGACSTARIIGRS